MPHSEASDVGLLLFLNVPSALHALSNARPPCMRRVAGSILGSGNILSLRLVMKIIYSAILSLPLVQVGLAKGCALAQEQRPSRHNQRC